MAARNVLGRAGSWPRVIAKRTCPSCQATFASPSIGSRRLLSFTLPAASTSSSHPLSPTLSCLLSSPLPEKDAAINVTGRIISVRTHAKVTFLNLTDGSLPSTTCLQAVLRSSPSALPVDLAPGAAIKLTGRLIPTKRDPTILELLVDKDASQQLSLKIVGSAQSALYPFPNTGVSPTPETARKNAHLRSRLPKHAAVLRMRSRAENAMSAWFEEHEFVRVTAPSITTSDCEGAGEVFRVIGADEVPEPGTKASLSSTASNTPFFAPHPAYLTVSSQLHLEALAQGLGRVWTCAPVWRAEGSATGRHLAEFWMAEPEWVLGGNSVAEQQGAADESGEGATTDRDLTELMDVAESVLKRMMCKALGVEASPSSVARVDTQYLHADAMPIPDEEALQGHSTLSELERYAGPESWARMTYTEAIELLQQHLTSSTAKATQLAKETTLPAAPIWGDSLSSAHERFLAGQLVRGPVFVTDYPAAQKAFYMRHIGGSRDGHEDRRIVAAFDLLVPRLGELVGGSVREERADVVRERLLESLNMKDAEAESSSTPKIGNESTAHPLDWYTSDLRRFGAHRTGGFGIGIERFVAWLAGLDNVRDATAFPRTKGLVRF